MNYDIPNDLLIKFCRYKISLEGFEEQDIISKCPECETDLEKGTIVGWGLYPKGGFRSQMKPNRSYGLGYECPKCFTKSCYHMSIPFFDEIFFKHLNAG